MINISFFILGKHKKHSKFSSFFDDEKPNALFDNKIKSDYSPPLSPKPKDKHNKLRETIEKLKAKSEMARIKSTEYDFEFDDHPKENKDKGKKQEKEDKNKIKTKDKLYRIPKKDTELDLDGNSTMDSIQSESKKLKKNLPKSNNSIKNSSTMDALSIATEQTLKDINKWLDDTPKFSEFSSASNSPSYTGLDEFDIITGRIDQIVGKKPEKMSVIKKEGVKDFKRRPFRDPAKFFKRREVQRTIDRLQPGKSKGNLISNVQNTKVDEIFPLGPLSKIKDTKNSLIVKTDTNAPKLSLGSVLDSFGKHKFVDDQKKEERASLPVSKEEIKTISPCKIVDEVEKKDIAKEKTEIKEDNQVGDTTAEDNSGGATPNLSAWFKAFGAPKMQPPQKKAELKTDTKENEKCEDINKTADSRKIAVSTASSNPDSPIMTHGQPVARQRKISTGSSMSERSSFSQDMDSPRVGIDERGAYPAPYPSPLHRSPSGASPVMASPRPDISPKAATYPTINGQIRVGFYQDTVSNKSSPDKSCSPREIPQSPYPQYSEHVYTPNTTESSYYSYTNSPYYTHPPNYSSTNPTPPYNLEMSSSSYYDTSKSLTDQYQAKTAQNYTTSFPTSNQSSPTPHPQQSPSIHSQHSPSVLPQHSPSVQSQQSPGVHSPHSPQHSPSIHSQHSPSVHSQHSPSMLSQHSPSIQSQQSPSIHSQLSPDLHSQQSPGIYQQHSPNVLPQSSPRIHPQGSNLQQPPTVQCPNSPTVHSQHSPNLHPPLGLPPQQSPNIHPNPPSIDVFQHPEEQNQMSEKILQQPPQSAMFPVKKRVYNDNDNQNNTQRFDIDTRIPQREINRSLQMGQQMTLEAMGQEQLSRQEVKDNPKPYIHQNIPDPKPLSVQTSMDSFSGTSSTSFSQEQTQQQSLQIQKESTNVRSMSYNSASMSNPYTSSFSNESNYLNIPTARSLATSQQSKIDMSKYTNMGYSGPDVTFSRPLQQFNRPELNYSRTTVPSSVPQKQQCQPSVGNNQTSILSNDMPGRCGNPVAGALPQLGYKGVELNRPMANPQQAHSNFGAAMHSSNTPSDSVNNRLQQVQEVPSGYKPEVSIPRPTYNTSSIDVEQPLSLGRNISNLSHIVDRFGNDDCIITGLQSSASYYSDKGLGTSHMFNKPISTSTSGLPMFSQANVAAMQSYNQSVQGAGSTMYNRQMTELQNPAIIQGDPKGNLQSQPVQEKKTKKRKSSKSGK